MSEVYKGKEEVCCVLLFLMSLCLWLISTNVVVAGVIDTIMLGIAALFGILVTVLQGMWMYYEYKLQQMSEIRDAIDVLNRIVDKNDA